MPWRLSKSSWLSKNRPSLKKVSQRAEAKDQRNQRPKDQEARREVDSQE
jgi:hypothetical protein